MVRGGFLVDQIMDGQVVLDYDVSYSRSELREVLCAHFCIENEKELVGSYDGRPFRIYAKNITYLGNPWESYKKRIQLGTNFKETVLENRRKGITTLLLGVYHYEKTLLFTEFDADSYADGKSHNSAAHVQTYDLQRALEEGIYAKIDAGNHKVTVFRPDKVEDFMKIKFLGAADPLEPIKRVFDMFYDSLPKTWIGIDCYKEMMEAKYRDRRQTEWAGFYHEYRFSKYLDENPERKEIVVFQKKKKDEDLDLDLFYPQLQTYGDLKAHTIGDAILGNSYETLRRAMEIGSLYYVILEHRTIKDKEVGYRTIAYWQGFVREASKRDHDPMRQASRMKAQVDLVDFVILQIDKYNVNLLSSFQKGFMNSDGLPRNEKFMISEKDIKEFVRYKKQLT